MNAVLTVDYTERRELASVTCWVKPEGLTRYPDGTWRVESCERVDVLNIDEAVKAGVLREDLLRWQNTGWCERVVVIYVKDFEVVKVEKDTAKYRGGVPCRVYGYIPRHGHDHAALMREWNY